MFNSFYFNKIDLQLVYVVIRYFHLSTYEQQVCIISCLDVVNVVKLSFSVSVT